MASDKDSGLSRVPNFEDRVLRNFLLLASPWVLFQQEMLAIAKNSLEQASKDKPVEKLMSREAQALMMILDPSEKWRGLLDRDLQNKIEEIYKKTVPKFAAGSIQLVEAQEAFLRSVSELLEKLRTDQKPSGHRSGKTSG
jgi:hypothetical protein